MKQTILATAILAAMLSFGVSVFAQAAAEAALSHGLSSSAGSAAGKTLGHALGNAAGQVGGRLGQKTSTTSRQRVPAAQISVKKNVPVASTPDSAAPAPGSLIVSIQGGDAAPQNCATVQTGANAEPPKADAKVPNATAAGDCSAKLAQAAESHPAVLNLPAPH